MPALLARWLLAHGSFTEWVATKKNGAWHICPLLNDWAREIKGGQDCRSIYLSPSGAGLAGPICPYRCIY